MVVMTPVLKQLGQVKHGNENNTPSSIRQRDLHLKPKISPLRIIIGESMTLYTDISATQFFSTLISSLSSSHAVSIS